MHNTTKTIQYHTRLIVDSLLHWFLVSKSNNMTIHNNDETPVNTTNVEYTAGSQPCDQPRQYNNYRWEDTTTTMIRRDSSGCESIVLKRSLMVPSLSWNSCDEWHEVGECNSYDRYLLLNCTNTKRQELNNKHEHATIISHYHIILFCWRGSEATMKLLSTKHNWNKL